MNKKRLYKILSIAAPLLIAVVALMPQIASAATCPWWLIFTPSGLATCTSLNVMTSLVAELGNLFLQIMSWLVGITGLILNMAIVLTLNIKTIYEATPAIEQTWIIVRNISSIFIIFALLYASINTILGTKGPQFGSLVAKIFLAGILINFSLFFTRVLIDASNLVSLQFYKAIVPNSKHIDLGSGNPKEALRSVLDASFGDGGLSDVLQQSLKLPKIYNNKGKTLSIANNYFLIAVGTIGGGILMFAAAMSFLAAGVAFIIRLVTLLLIMGFSPLFFVGMIFPQVNSSMVGKWKGYLTSNLIFMPAYLFFMYVALKFLSGDGFFKALDDAQKAAGTAQSGSVFLSDVGLVFQFIIAFVFISVPMIAALELGGKSAAIGAMVAGKFGGMFTSLRKGAQGAVGRNVAGRAGKFAGEQFDNMAASDFAQKSSFGKGATTVLRGLGISQGVRGGLESVEKGKYGSSQSLSDVEKEDKERNKQIRKVALKKRLATEIEANNQPEIKKILNGMSTSEIAGLGKKVLTNPNIIPHLSSEVYKNIDKGDKDENEKVEISEARTKAFGAAIASAALTGNSTIVKMMMKNMSGADLEKSLETVPRGTPVPDSFIEHLKPNQMKDMENIDGSLRREIGLKVAGWAASHGGRSHPALDHVQKNPTLWS